MATKHGSAAAAERRGGINRLKLALLAAREQEQHWLIEDLLLQLGTAYQSNGQPKLAVSAWQESMSRAKARGADAQEAQISERIGHAFLGMKHTSRAYDAFHHAFILYTRRGDFEELLHAGSRLAYLDGVMGFMDNAQALFRQVRSGYRKRGDQLLEAVSYVRQAEVLWEKNYQRSEALGLLRHALERFEQILGVNSDPMEGAILAQEQQKALALSACMLGEIGEERFQTLFQESALSYQKARLEEEVDREEERQYLQDRAGEIERLGYLRHDRERRETLAQPAVSAIAEHGVRLASCTFYQELLPQLRRAHNRLAEAILRGTVLLIQQVAEGKRSWSGDEQILALYHQCGDSLGLAKTFYNSGVAFALSRPSQFKDAYACVWCAMNAFVRLAHVDLQVRARSLLSSWEGEMSPPQAKAAQERGEAFFERYFVNPREIGMYRGPQPESILDSTSQQRYASASHILQATERIFSEMLQEVQAACPSRLVWNVYEEGTMLHSETLGISLADDPLARKGQFRLQYLTQGTFTFDQGRVQSPALSPLSSRSEDGFEPGIQVRDAASLLIDALDYLDREYTERFDARGIEIVDAHENPVLQLAWHRNILGTSWRK